jgi:deoxyinosine 3'endonuclease (endonuclease V)
MIPLYINSLHWKLAKILLQPWFGYMFTLNINGFSFEQYYTLYFIIYQHVILDMKKNENSEAIKRILSQVKMCCMDIYENFKQRLDPKVDEFLLKHTNRTKDIIPNMNTYLLLISMDVDSLNKIKIDQNNFEYFYFEEHLRRFLESNFTKPESIKYFNLDLNEIHNGVDKLFDCEFQDAKSAEEILNKIKTISLVPSLCNQKFCELIEAKANLKLDLDIERYLKKETKESFKDYFRKFKNSHFSKLYNYVFELEEQTVFKDHIKKFSLMHQLLKHGFTNEKWRNHANYIQFKTTKDSSDYLMNEFLNEFRNLFNKIFNEKLEFKKKEVENIKVKEFLDTDQYELYKFNASEKTFGHILKALQFEGNLNSIIKLVEKIFYISFQTPTHLNSNKMWEPSSKASKSSKRFRLFKMIYLFENKINETKHEKSLEFLTRRYTDNPLYAKYLFQLYAFDIDRNFFNQTDKTLKEYMDPELFLEFKANKKDVTSKLNDDVIGKIVHFEIFSCKQQSNQGLKLLKKSWISEQFKMQKNNVLVNSKEWQNDLKTLKRVAVLGISFDRHKSDKSTCCGTVLIFELIHEKKCLKLVHVNIIEAKIKEHFIRGLEVFREDDLYEKMINAIPKDVEPDCFIFNGHGLLNEREFGLASQIGVKMNLVSFGLSKKMITIKNVFSFKNLVEAQAFYKPLLKQNGDSIELKTITTNKVLGYAYLPNIKALDPLFLSPGLFYFFNFLCLDRDYLNYINFN